MLRIAIGYDNRFGRDDGNPGYIRAALKRKEEKGLLDVDFVLPMGDLAMLGHYDVSLIVDWGEDGLKGLLPYIPIYPKADKTVYWASDTHIHDASYQYRLEMARKADIVFCAQLRGVREFRRDGINNALLLPHAVEPLAYSDPATVRRDGNPLPYEFASKEYDVCFVGHINAENRINALDRLFREFPNFWYGQRLFNEASEKYSRSKICFNIAMTDDINMRVYEIMGSKSFLLTNWVPGIEGLFEDGKHLVLYRSEEEMIEKAKYYLAHDDEREKIAQAGYEEVMAKHTIDRRVDRILEEVNKKVMVEV